MDLSSHTKLVLTRKPNHPELVFNTQLQASDQLAKKQLDLENGAQQWQLSFDDRECYVCNKHPYVQVFYRRCKAESEYEEITSEAEIKSLRELYQIDELQSRGDALATCPLIFGTMLRGKRGSGT